MTKGSELLRDAGITAPELARGLGWFSLALGTMELLLPRTITGFLGMRGREGLVRLYGVREVGTGLAILGSSDPAPWMWGRVAGDALDVATVAPKLAGRKPGNVALALLTLAAVAALDVLCAEELERGR